MVGVMFAPFHFLILVEISVEGLFPKAISEVIICNMEAVLTKISFPGISE